MQREARHLQHFTNSKEREGKAVYYAHDIIAQSMPPPNVPAVAAPMTERYLGHDCSIPMMLPWSQAATGNACMP